jgi:hypothetical protein
MWIDTDISLIKNILPVMRDNHLIAWILRRPKIYRSISKSNLLHISG